MPDAIVIGGGFYGASIAGYLVERRHFHDVLVIERASRLLSRASYANQARVHNGYHYPRSYTTGFRSAKNYRRFVHDFAFAVRSSFTTVYAVARQRSKTTAGQFQRFCREIGVQLEQAPPELRRLFAQHAVEDVFVAEECGFDASALQAWAERTLERQAVKLALDSTVTAIAEAGADGFVVSYRDQAGEQQAEARYVFNCTYSGISQFGGAFSSTIPIKHEICELALVEVPAPLQELGITIMDGPFFSCMPFPARGLHSLSHVRYTPHTSWDDVPGENPWFRLNSYARESRADRMLRAAAQYVPAMADARHSGSLFEVKTVLCKNEGDDGRPILFERPAAFPNYFLVLGGKIDNIYDILERMDELPLQSSGAGGRAFLARHGRA